MRQLQNDHYRTEICGRINHPKRKGLQIRRHQLYDDVRKLQSRQSNQRKKYVIDFPSEKFLETTKATFIKGGNIKSPMGGNTQAYQNKSAAEKAAATLGASLTK